MYAGAGLLTSLDPGGSPLGDGRIFPDPLTVTVREAQQALSQAEKKKIHDKQFGGQSDEIARQLAASGEQHVEFDAGPAPVPSNDPPDKLMEMYACNAHAVLFATPQSYAVEASGIGHTVYTTWQMDVEEVFKQPLTRPVPWPSQIDVLTNGGSIQVGKRRVTVRDARFEIVTTDRRYLLFLRLVEGTGAFVPWFVVDMSEERPRSSPPGSHRQLEGLPTGDLVILLREKVMPAVLRSDQCSRED